MTSDIQDETPDPPHARRTGTARQAILITLLTAFLLVILEGTSIRAQGEEMEEGWERSVVQAVGGPTGWVAEKLPFASAADQVEGWFSADEDLGSEDGGFTAATGGSGVSSKVTPEAFDPVELGEKEAVRPQLERMLVTGDSMSQPLDAELARLVAERGVRVKRDPKIGTGISKSDIVDWGKLAAEQAREKPEAVVVFLGANEGFPMQAGEQEVECCGAAWAAEYATRVRSIVDSYRAGGARRVYWTTIPAPRDAKRVPIARAVNAAIRVAAAPYGATVRVVDAAGIFSPGFRFDETLAIDGEERLVRDQDGIHLNEEGASLLAERLASQLERDFTLAEG